MGSFKMRAVDEAELAELITQHAPRGVRSKGGELIEDFVGSGNVAVTVQFGSTKERNAVSISATNYARAKGAQVWVRKLGGGTGNQLLLVNLAKADAATRKAYEERPRPGRRPSKR